MGIYYIAPKVLIPSLLWSFIKKLAFSKIREIKIFFNNKKFKPPPIVIINIDIGILIYGENKKLEKISIIAETGRITDNINSHAI